MSDPAVSVFMWRSGYKSMGLRFNKIVQSIDLSREEARDLGKALITMADLADELDKEDNGK